MVYGYCRVSTNGQAANGNSLEAQEKTLKDHGATQIYYEHFSGSKIDRPELQLLLKTLKKNDTLVVTKLDRLARSMTEGSKLVDELIKKGVRVDICNIGRMDNTPSSKLIRGIFFAFAEFERDMIIERTSEGKAIAKQRDGFKDGRPKEYTPEQLAHAVELLKTHSYRQVETMTKISKSTIQRAKREADSKSGDGTV